MRARKEIEKDIKDEDYLDASGENQKLIIEILLDIRDKLKELSGDLTK